MTGLYRPHSGEIGQSVKLSALMPSWDPAEYGTFLDWRTRPSRDLIQRVNLTSPQRIIDLGCGPGNSTALCTERWPEAAIAGMDSSPEMIESARTSHPHQRWEIGDIGEWVRRPDLIEHFDLIFSCAALQWVGNHADVFPQLVRKLLSPGGVLAVHMPAYDAIPNRVMREMAASDPWRKWFPEGRAEEWRSHALEFYYAILAPFVQRLDLWATDYLHIMPDVDGIVEWYKGTGLRPYLGAIQDAQQQEEFLDEYRTRLIPFYPASPAGGVPFPFRRLFIVAGV